MFALRLVSTTKLNALKADGKIIGSAAASGLATAVILAAKGGIPVGAPACVAIDEAEETGKPGHKRKADAMVTVRKVIVAEADCGGTSAAIADGKNFASLIIDEALASM